MNDEQQFHGIFFVPPISSNFLGHQISEVYRDNIYAPFLHGKDGLTILDIGANIGVTTYYFSQFAKRVYSLEPARDHFLTLTRMLAFNKLENVTPINKAIYIRKEKLPLYHDAKNKTMYSLHSAVGSANNFEKEDVETITLGDLFEEYKIEHVDFMKLDVEGSETEILSSTSFLEVSSKIDTVVTEWHEWSGRPQQQLIDALKNAGYKVDKLVSSANVFVGQR